MRDNKEMLPVLSSHAMGKENLTFNPRQLKRKGKESKFSVKKIPSYLCFKIFSIIMWFKKIRYSEVCVCMLNNVSLFKI